jgi:hypothetical protein
VPLTAAGNLRIVASSDLGGLGDKAGAPVEYNWVLPSLAPQLLPWVLLLVLLALKPNRCAQAWTIWLPVGCALALSLLPIDWPSGADFLLDDFGALVLGVAAVWLLAGYLRRSHRVVTFFCVLFALAGFSLLAFLFKQSGNQLDFELLPFAILLGVGVFTSAFALSVAGWICRRRFRPAGLCVWLLVSLLVLWLAIAAPFFIFALVASGNQIPWSEFLIPVLGMAAGNFALLLPFLILSAAHPYYRERLKSLLHVQTMAPPLLAPLAQPADKGA